MQELFRTKHSKHFDTGRVWIDEKGIEHPIIEATIQKGMNYLNKVSNKYEESDCVWDITEKDTFGSKIKKADHNLRIYNQGQDKKLRFGFDKNIYVEYILPNIESIYNGNECVFTNAWTNTDIKLTVTPEGIKNDIILKSSGHPTSFDFLVSVNGCTPQKEGNTIVFYKSGIAIGSIPAPYAEDANGDRGAVALDHDGVSVRFVPDPIWLARATYPVTVDPTTVIQPDATAGKDSCIRSWGATTNYGTETSSPAGTAGTTYICRTMYQFDVNSLTGNSITSAILSLKSNSGLTGSPISLETRKITAAWTEAGVNWNNRPTYDAPIMSTASVNSTGIFFDFAIDSAVAQAWIDTPATNYGVYIKASDSVEAQSPTTPNKYAYFAMSDDSTAANRPKLTIIYTAASNPTSVFGSINTLGRRLIA